MLQLVKPVAFLDIMSKKQRMILVFVMIVNILLITLIILHVCVKLVFMIKMEYV
jgi:hypothetical protein